MMRGTEAEGDRIRNLVYFWKLIDIFLAKSTHTETYDLNLQIIFQLHK
jgi:hypothetical protein